MDVRRRLDGLQHAMQQQGIDLAVYGACPNFQYLTGIPVNWRMAPDLQPPGNLVFVPRYGEPALIISDSVSAEGCPFENIRPYDASAGYRGMVNSVVKDMGVIGRLATGDFLSMTAIRTLLDACDSPVLCDGAHLMDHLRKIKEPEEVIALRNAAQLTDDVMSKVIDNIRDGVSQLDLMLEMESEARRMGASDVSFAPWACFVETGSAAPNPDSHRVTECPIDKGLVAHTAITFDVGFVIDGYCSDWGRSVYWGAAPQDVKSAYAALQQSVVDAVEEMTCGSMRACDVYPAIERRLDAMGFGDQMRARLAPERIIGHQIGTEVHENPWLRPDSQELLRAGMVMCIEPKLWVPGEYYLRVEDMVHITETGAEFLTRFDRELFEL